MRDGDVPLGTTLSRFISAWEVHKQYKKIGLYLMGRPH